MKTLIGIILTVSSSTLLLAQPNRIDLSPEEKATFRTNKMLEQGLINEDQKADMYAIHLAAVTDMETLREREEAAREAFKKDREAIHQRTEAAMITKMTPEQQQQFELKKAQREAKLQEQRAQHSQRHLRRVEHAREYNKNHGIR